MSSIRPPAEEGALVRSLLAAAEGVDATLDIGPWRDVADLRLVRLEAERLEGLEAERLEAERLEGGE
jgi:hypothetical protein